MRQAMNRRRHARGQRHASIASCWPGWRGNRNLHIDRRPARVFLMAAKTLPAWSN